MGDGFRRGWVPKSGELGGVEGQQWAKTAKAAGSAIPQYESAARGLGSGELVEGGWWVYIRFTALIRYHSSCNLVSHPEAPKAQSI